MFTPFIQVVKDDLHKTESYIVATESKVTAWIMGHWYVILFFGVVLGWFLSASYHHHYPTH